MTVAPFCRFLPTLILAEISPEKSGLFVSSTGVGTAIIIKSAEFNFLKSVVGSKN